MRTPTLLDVCPDTTVYCIYQITGSKRLLARRQWLGGSVVLLVGSQCWKRRSASSMPCASKWLACRCPPLSLQHMYVCLFIRMCAYVYVHAYVCMHMYACACMYMYMYIRTYIHRASSLPCTSKWLTCR